MRWPLGVFMAGCAPHTPPLDDLVIITGGHAPAVSIANCLITASHDYYL